MVPGLLKPETVRLHRMYLKTTLATLLLAGLYCPLAPAKYKDGAVTPSVPVMTKVEFQKSVMVSDYTTPNKENEAEEQDQVGGADLMHAVWYHLTDVPLIFSDVAYHNDPRMKKKSAATVGGSAGYVYDQNTKKK
jgi:hypothetical protein